ncbi:glycosyltransferase family 8 protein [Dothistroma septosporum NZE10]|uniref:Glycosyltransferase family 8 protein n=1 Tax=Dothistroma septosporum (strain NZE10 / CBS 128990) TaxID=675120 RepID=N1PS57_DOTSN|nr:glycosyltransferase family 8 protein [Dothistroma septosporum NZE10]
MVDLPATPILAATLVYEKLSLSTSHPAASPAALVAPVEEETHGYGSKLFFEDDLPYKFPKLDIDKLKTMAPHHYKGPGHPTFATMFLSRNGSLHDPYFLSTHEVVYRLLWNPDTKSTEHPVTVFVAPFVAPAQRSSFEAIGAIVREVKEMPFQPDVQNGNTISHRFRDVFSKLEMWAQADFSRIAYLDSDAFPLANVDALMGQQLAPQRNCRRELLWTVDQTHPEESCRYTFTGVQDIGVSSMINAGMLVLQPNEAMHELLLREFHDPDNTGLLNSGFPEQGLLSHVFRMDGPFPATIIGKAWNGDPGVKDGGAKLNILHAKLWALQHEGAHWTDGMFAKTWEDLSTFYASEGFASTRAQDAVLSREYFAASGH